MFCADYRRSKYLRTVSKYHMYQKFLVGADIVKIAFCYLALGILGVFLGTQARAESTPNREYCLKAAFLYNFMVFTDWPKEALPDTNKPMVIGIIGEDPFGDAFEPISEQRVKGRRVLVQRFKGFEPGTADGSKADRTTEDIRKCHLLFICGSEAARLNNVVDMVRGYPVLTVADTPGFLESGGMANLIVDDKKIRFEVSVVAAGHARLKIGSQLLRLAKRIIREWPGQTN